MHADRPGERPRLLYWYRTAAGITLGRPPLDEDAIRTIEEQHPDIDFDWPAILALSAAMTPEDEETPKAQAPRPAKKRRDREDRDREPASAAQRSPEPRRDDRASQSSPDVDPDASAADAVIPETSTREAEAPRSTAPRPIERQRPSGLVDQLAGREIAARLRARYDEMSARVRQADESVRESLVKRAEALDPDQWDTPEAVLQGVSNADALFEKLRSELAAPS